MINVDELRLNELEEAAEFLKFTWVDTYSHFLSQATIQKMTDFWLNTELLKKQVLDPDILFLSAKDDSHKIVGMLTVIKLDKETALLARMFVHPEKQRRGIGMRLLNEAIERLRGYKKMRAEVEEKNTRGMNFCLKQGFKEIETKRELVEQALMYITVLEKTLGSQPR
jgi:GNAT superfamily N-acetyltransferase